jgi:Domain of unknown function (DUF4381)
VKSSPLDKLHDFYQPQPPSWVPQTIGWYFVLALLLLLVAWGAWHVFESWRRNRYRREALREIEGVDIAAIPALLKRTALAAWPREEVASLSGEAWLQFLAKHGNDNSFTDGVGRCLLDLDYRGARLQPAEEAAMRESASNWIRRHRVHI